MSGNPKTLYSNKHLVEVICGFNFPEETTTWDNTIFGVFSELIKDKGFNVREERKGVQLNFTGEIFNSGKSPITASQLEDQIIFKNPLKGHAILLGKNMISFHVTANYKSWEVFQEDLIKPFIVNYSSLGLGNGKRNCTVVYLNKFEFSPQDNLSKYFTIISPLDDKFGKEVATIVQRTISNQNNFLVAKLTSQVLNNSVQNVFLECGSVCVNSECMNNPDWLYQADQTHEPVFNFFEALLTNEQKRIL